MKFFEAKEHTWSIVGASLAGIPHARCVSNCHDCGSCRATLSAQVTFHDSRDLFEPHLQQPAKVTTVDCPLSLPSHMRI